MKSNQIKLQDCLNTRAYHQDYYPFWRKPLSASSFYILYFLVKFLKVKNAYIATFATIFFGIAGGISIFFGFIYTAIFFLIISYIFDLIDGKIARLYNKQNINAKFIDWIYHTITPAFGILATGYYIYLQSFEILYFILASFFVIFFLHKIFLSFLYLQIHSDILSTGQHITGTQNNGDYESEIEKTYGGYKSYPLLFILYNYCGRLFIDSTDIVFGLCLFLLFGLEKYFVILLFTVNFLLWGFSIVNKFKQLYTLEIRKHEKKD